MHIFVHYTIPGASFALGLAEFLSPAMEFIGLDTVFTNTAAAAEMASHASELSIGAGETAGAFNEVANQAIDHTSDFCLSPNCPIHGPNGLLAQQFAETAASRAAEAATEDAIESTIEQGSENIPIFDWNSGPQSMAPSFAPEPLQMAA